MRILGIETSCDETGAAVVEGTPGNNNVKLLSTVVASSLALHAKTGGIIPEVAAREQIKYIIPAINQALSEAGGKIDAIGVTIGPGLIGSLLVGVEAAKTLAYVWKKPIIPVNHLIGHIYANWLTTKDQKPTTIIFPALALIVSGGHTDLVLMRNHQQLTWIGGTRDDAAGEAFDKIGRLLGLSYPAGPVIAAEAAKYQISPPKADPPLAENIKYSRKLRDPATAGQIKLPRPMLDKDNFDFSFSGLKTAALREVNKLKEKKQFNNVTIQQLAFEVQQAIVDVLVKKTTNAAQKYRVKSILLSGGVAANEKLREQMSSQLSALNSQLYAPPAHLCTDNGAMIASAAFFRYKPASWESITAKPSLHF